MTVLQVENIIITMIEAKEVAKVDIAEVEAEVGKVIKQKVVMEKILMKVIRVIRAISIIIKSKVEFLNS